MSGRRTPPHSKEAEASVIGSCLLSRQSVASCVSALLPADFYDPKLARIFAAITDLHAAGAAVDPQTVAAQLDKKNALEEIGGVQALVRIQAATPASANHVHYALAVAELATLRRALEISSAIEDAAYDRKLDEVERLLGEAEQRLCPPLAAVEPGHDLSTLLLADTTYDWKLTGCLEALERLIITGTEGSGKLLALATKIPTTTGWTTMGQVQPGDELLGVEDKTHVLAVTETVIPERAWQVTFSDGARFIAGGKHQWQVTLMSEYPLVVTTDELAVLAWDSRLRPCVTGPGVALKREVKSVEQVPAEPMRCLQVDAFDGQFLVGDEHVPTHNSTLLRQMAVQLACGVHPFVPHEEIPRCRVLHVDLENSPRQSEREYQRIAKPAVREKYEPGWLSVKYRPQGINLAEKADVRWLEALVVHHEPEFLIVGPLYKMLRETKMASVHSEETAQACAYALDELRVRYGLVMIIEAHSAKGDGRTGVRGLEPIGSSLWLRWPEFGIGLGLRKDGARLVDWRGPRDRNRIWPKHLSYGQTWPWLPSEPF